MIEWLRKWMSDKPDPLPAHVTAIYFRDKREMELGAEAIGAILRVHDLTAARFTIPFRVSAFIPPNRACFVWSDGRIKIVPVRLDRP